MEIKNYLKTTLSRIVCKDIHIKAIWFKIQKRLSRIFATLENTHIVS